MCLSYGYTQKEALAVFVKRKSRQLMPKAAATPTSEIAAVGHGCQKSDRQKSRH
jgi:hypothetical protein